MNKKNIGNPLTIEQLREMDGKPVYCPDDGIWGIISVDSTGRWAGIPFFRGRTRDVNIEYDIESRGMSVYACPPAHIDREAWEPCSECEPNELIMGDRYCPQCGRPLTEKAWDELKKRIGGAK